MSYPTTEVEGPHLFHERGATTRRIGIGLLVVFLVVVATGALGPRTTEVSAARPGTEFTVNHPRVVRPGLDSEVTVAWRHEQRSGAAPGTVRLAVDSALLSTLGIEHIAPAPRAETSDGTRLILDFEATDAERFTVTFSGRVPTRQPAQKVNWKMSLPDLSDPLTVEATTWVLP